MTPFSATTRHSQGRSICGSEWTDGRGAQGARRHGGRGRRSRAIARREIAALDDDDDDHDHDHNHGNNDNRRRHVEFAVARSSKWHPRADGDCAEKGGRSRKDSRRRPRAPERERPKKPRGPIPKHHIWDPKEGVIIDPNNPPLPLPRFPKPNNRPPTGKVWDGDSGEWVDDPKWQRDSGGGGDSDGNDGTVNDGDDGNDDNST